MILWGQSAAAHAVDSYAYAHPEDAIVTGLVASSGANGGTANATTTGFTDLATKLGCGNLTADAELACMQKVDALAIQKAVVAANNTAFGGSFGPAADNITVWANSTERMEKGLISKVVRHL